MNSTKHAIFAICALAAVASLAADVTYEGRLISSSGHAIAGETLAATLRAYETEDSADSFAESAISISTDAQGFFAATASISVPTAYQSFWIGVTPEGDSEILPRMHVLPVPSAIKALTADRLESEEPIIIPAGSSLYANNFSSDAALTVTNAEFTGSATLSGGVQGAGNIYISDLDPGNGHLSMLRTDNPEGISKDFGTFVPDKTVEAWTYIPEEIKSTEITAEDDGFAIVSINSSMNYTDKTKQSYVHATIDNGDFVVGEGVNLLYGIDGHQYFTLPVRKGKVVTVILKCFPHGNWDGANIGRIESTARIKMFYFGAK